MQRNITKSAMNSGLILGALFSVNFLFSIIRNTAFVLLSYAMIAIILVTIYRLSVRFRDVECEGFISFGKVFLYILLTFFYAALISSVVKFVYFKFINTGYLEIMFQETMKAMQMMKYPINDTSVEQMKGMLKPASFSFIYIWFNLSLGAIVGLIMAAFIKKNKSVSDDKQEN
jgi:hypothetical protein